jgi:RNA polymerase sigma-70 factor (ECF subfamily)
MSQAIVCFVAAILVGDIVRRALPDGPRQHRLLAMDRSSAGKGESTSFSDDAELIRALRAGDDAAFEALVRTHSGAMLAVARRLLRDEDEANDALQEAFISVFRSIDKFEGNSKLSTWLHRIVVNSALMKLRTRKRAAERSIESFLPRFLEDGHQAEPAGAWREPNDAERHETQALVRQCIDQLPETHRTVLILRDIEEMSTDEAAAALGVTATAVKVRLHRARQALRTLLDPHFRGGAA